MKSPSPVSAQCEHTPPLTTLKGSLTLLVEYRCRGWDGSFAFYPPVAHGQQCNSVPILFLSIRRHPPMEQQSESPRAHTPKKHNRGIIEDCIKVTWHIGSTIIQAQPSYRHNHHIGATVLQAQPSYQHNHLIGTTILQAQPCYRHLALIVMRSSQRSRSCFVKP